MTVIKEEVDITPYVERGLVGVNVDAVRDNINTFLNGSLGKCFVTPYIALERVRKVLANFHIFLPRTTFLEGDRGVEVFDIKQFGEVMGMRDDGSVVTKVSDPYSLYFEYKMNDKGMFEVFAEIVTQEELDDLMSAVEDDMNDDDDADDDREEKLDESSESVHMSGPETGARRITGQPDYGMAPDYYGGSGCDDEKPKMKLVIKKDSPLEEVYEFSKGLRSKERNDEIEAKRPKNWVDKAQEPKKPSFLDRLRKKKV